MSKVRVISEAEWEYTEALSWYAERSIEAADGFDAEFDKAFEMIGADPNRFPRCDNRHRFYLMDRYPYQVIYREEAEEILIVAIAHAKRRPGYWAGR